MRADSKYPPSVKAGKPILGETPEGWARESLKKHLTLEQRKVKVLDDKEYDLVTVKRSRGGVVRREHLYGKQISVKSQFYLKQGDFLISKRQIVHGACGIVPEHLDGSIVSNEYSIFTAKDSFDLNYLRYLSETLYFQQTCFHSSIGVHIEKMIFKLDNWFKWDFNLSPLPEQRKIAQILSTWDRGIATTEKLIDASKQQKKALMQQLLTGKKRLIGPETGKAFEGDWVEGTLASILTKIIDYRGQSVPKASTGIPLITARNVRNGFLDFTSKEYIDESEFSSWMKRGTPEAGDILFTTEAPMGMACRYPSEGVYGVGQRTVTLRVNDKIYSDFLLYYLLSEKGQLLIELRSSGSTAKGIKSSELKKLDVIYPVNVKEQQKIASVLTAADKEIEFLNAKLAHFKQEKKALMQQLLMGKRRVTIDDNAAA
ncbi:restriction endonuclease subunit S [Aliivibrio sifiae]|uniref:Restriction endonuclease S subunits-like protein n=1 Tax=Aliivibrio sifiae TaxID=566293 RepID=A0A2S7XIC7_9GAMM|nr:restriction endonuclease subunit S [Aliivibrio sifiae]PQJ93353.1 hypothetical protein BTO23_04470 [Aliivibrio sifiae]GLR74566.1 restriction endonuclease S subunits-like protein [Aliivibrio sifiae]